jgi:mRNA-degrading endonuclease RelE of RelBE toxin-antitoxin system
MTYAITWKAAATRDMDRLPLAIGSGVVEFIYGPLAQNPHRVGKPLRFELAGKRSARGGNYRVIYEILETAVQVEVIAVQHRAECLSLSPGGGRRTRTNPNHRSDPVAPRRRMGQGIHAGLPLFPPPVPFVGPKVSRGIGANWE